MRLFKLMAIVLVSSVAMLSAMQSIDDMNPNERRQAFIQAVQKNNINDVRNYLLYGIGPNFEIHGSLNDYDKTPLGAAIIANNPEMVKLLLENGADPNLSFSAIKILHPLIRTFRQSELKCPGQENRDTIIQLLLANPQTNFKETDEVGRPIFQRVMESGRFDFIKTMFLNPALDINSKNLHNQTPLILLFESRLPTDQTESLLDLILANPNLATTINAQDNEEQTALDYAQKIKDNKNILEKLIANGATAGTPSRRKISGGTYIPFSGEQPAISIAPTSAATASSYSSLPYPQRMPAIKPSAALAKPLSVPASLSQADKKLIDAVRDKNISDIDKAIKEGANPTILDPGTRHPLFHGLLYNFYPMDTDTVQKIINLIVAQPLFNPNNTDPSGKTALMLAIEKENIPLIEKLLNNPITDVTIQDKQGLTALSHAQIKGNKEIIELVRKKQSEQHASKKQKHSAVAVPSLATSVRSAAEQLKNAIISNNLDEIDRLFKAGVNPNIFDQETSEPLIIWALRNYNNYKPLNNFTAILDRFLANPLFNPNVKGKIEFVPSITSARASRPSAKTLLMIATQSGNKDIVRRLIADPRTQVNIRDNTRGVSALDYAIAKKDNDIIALLKSANAQAFKLNVPTAAVTTTISSATATSVQPPMLKPAASDVNAAYQALQLPSTASAYEILGVSQGDDDAYIDSTFELLSHLWDPTDNSDPRAPAVFQLIAKAYNEIKAERQKK